MAESSGVRIQRLVVEGFRSFERLSLESLGRVNLITGRNNTGKSSLLEAIRLFCGNAAPELLVNVLDYREELPSEGDDVAGMIIGLGNLLYGFPSLNDEPRPISIRAQNDGLAEGRLSISIGWFSEETSEEGFRKLVAVQPFLFQQPDAIPGLVVEANGVKRVYPIDTIQRLRRLGRQPDLIETRIPCVFVNPYGFRHTSALGALWDKVALSDREADVTNSLRILSPDILAVSMIGGEGPRKNRTAIVKVMELKRPVPLRTFGDGVNRLFGIVLSLVNAKGGVLLIDEVENGMHHTVQVDVWRAIFRISRELNVQVFASSHSWDSVSAFQIAAQEDPEEGVLIRLSRKGQQVVPTLFSEDDLRIVTRDRIEVR